MSKPVQLLKLKADNIDARSRDDYLELKRTFSNYSTGLPKYERTFTANTHTEIDTSSCDTIGYIYFTMLLILDVCSMIVVL